MPDKLGSGPRISQDLSKTGAGLSRGENRQKQVSNAPYASGIFPAPNSTLDLDFANNRGYVRGLGQGGVMDGITFTRASNANYVGPDGLLKNYSNQGALGKNLLTFPQDFGNADWVKTNLTIADNVAIAPDYTNTADKLVETSIIGIHDIAKTITVSSGVSYTVSFYAKAAERSYIQILFTTSQTSVYVNFDILNGSISAGTNGYGSMSDAGNGWYRCVVSIIPNNSAAMATIIHLISSADSARNESYTGNGTSGIYIWGAQLEVGSEATPYYPTNIGSPRFDWASTAQVANRNLLSYTEQFDDTSWSKSNILPFGSGSVANTTATLDPLGGNTADFIRESTATGTHTVEKSFSLTFPYVGSFYVKPSGRTWCVISVGTNNYVYFNLSGSGSVGSKTNANGTITLQENGWYRCVVVPNYSATQKFNIVLATADGVSSYTGDGTSGIYIWGAQLELGNAATPYQAITQPPTNTPLLPSSSCNGILIEESRTNRILYCRDATQANWVCANTTPLLNQTGIDGVANAATSLTATANNGTCIQTITLASGSRTGSVYLKRLTGTGNIQVSLDGTTWSTVDLSETEWRRIVLSGTVTNPVVGIKIVTSGDSVAMDFAQIEDGSFATSPIMTTTATATRSADLVQMSLANVRNFTSGYYGTYYIEGLHNGTGRLVDLVNGDNPNILIARRMASNNYQSFSESGGGSGSSVTTAADVSLQFKYACRRSYPIIGACVNGGVPAITTSSGILPNFAVGAIRFGNSYSGNNWINGWIKRFTHFPKNLPDSALQELTK